MNIQIRYQTHPEQLSRASLVFLEKRPLIQLFIYVFNTVAIFLALMIVIKVALLKDFGYQDVLGVLLCGLWLFGRKRLTEKMLTKRIQSSGIIHRDFHITASKNGIVWQGEGIKQGQVNWKDLKSIYRLHNGYILPCSASRFLWVPFDGFTKSEEISTFEEYCKKMDLKIKTVKKDI